MRYEDIIKRYEAIGKNIDTGFHLDDPVQVKSVLGFDITKVKGIAKLSVDDKELVTNLIINYINGFGLEARLEQKPTRIIKDSARKCFTVYFGECYSYLYFNGTIG